MSSLARSLVAILGCCLMGWFPFVRGSRVPVLGLVDLGFHELGHLLTYPFPDLITAVMGSVMQVAVPLGLAGYFAMARRDHLGASLCLGWAGTSAGDVAVYVADAPYERLRLLGGDHDWAFLLHRLDLMHRADELAALIAGLGVALVLAGIGLGFWIGLGETQAVPVRSAHDADPAVRPAHPSLERPARTAR